MQAKLQEWSRKKFRDRKRILQALTTKLTCLKSDPYQNYHGIRVVETQIDDFLRDEEIYWRQRSKALWLKERDRNTRYFHAKASSMKRRNTIDGLLDTNNQWREDILDIENEFSNYFTTLFTSCTPSQQNVELALQSLEHKVIAEMNFELDKEFSPEEIKSIIFQMHLSKAPGPNGLSTALECSG